MPAVQHYSMLVELCYSDAIVPRTSNFAFLVKFDVFS